MRDQQHKTPGPPPPPDFADVEHGPLNNNQRQCRDIFFMILFLANVAALIAIGVWSYISGSPYNAFRGTDQNKNICGLQNSDLADYPYSYFYNPIGINYRVCVKACPSYQKGVLSNVSCYGRPCNYSVVIKEDGTFNGSFNESHFVGYDSILLIERICLPNLKALNNTLTLFSTKLEKGVQSSYLNRFINDLQNNWRWILVGFGFAFVLSFILVFLMKWIAPIIIWFSITMIVILFAGFGVIFLYHGGTIQSNQIQNALGTLGIPTFEKNSYYSIYGYVCFGLAGVFILLVICCCSRIRLAIAICKVSSQFITRCIQIVLLPFVVIVFVLGIWALGLTAMVYLISSATFVANGDVFSTIDNYTQRSLGLFYYFFFGVLWTNAYFTAFTIFVVASCCCLWYYSQGPNNELSSPVMTSIWRSFRFHWGSLALGAFVISIIKALQLIVQGLKRQPQNTNPVTKCLFSWASCCIKCIEKIIQFLNKQAFIQIALRGKNFCRASMDGLQAIMSNPLRYTIVSGVGTIMVFVTELMIVAGATTSFWALITFVETIRNNVLEPIFLLIVVGVISLIIGVIFMSLFSITMDTILACFIADQINQKGKNGKPLYAPQEMIELMDR